MGKLACAVRRFHAVWWTQPASSSTPHHRTLLTLNLQLVDALQAALTELGAAVENP